MYYSSFWGFCGLALLLVLHGGYRVYSMGIKHALRRAKKSSRVLLFVTATVVAAAVVVGIVMMLLQVEAPAIHGMGLIVLLLAFALNGLLRRCAQEAEENEEE